MEILKHEKEKDDIRGRKGGRNQDIRLVLTIIWCYMWTSLEINSLKLPSFSQNKI
jgi:hypothetical protein